MTAWLIAEPAASAAVEATETAEAASLPAPVARVEAAEAAPSAAVEATDRASLAAVPAASTAVEAAPTAPETRPPALAS